MALSGWDKYIPAVFDHTKVDSDVTDFPALFYLSASSGIGNEDITCVFDEVGANWQKIALANNVDAETYVEKVSWDEVGKTAELHGLVSLSSAGDTTYKLWYDNDHADNTTYVKDQGDATSVWDSDFRFVAHMNDLTTSSIEDSTSNSLDFTKKGANEPIETSSGQIGEAQDFDGTDDYAYQANNIITATSFTVEGWAKMDGAGGGSNNNNVMFQQNDADSADNKCLVRLSIDDYGNHQIRVRSSNGITQNVEDTKEDNGAFHHYCGVVSASNITLYVDGVSVGTPVANNQSGDYTTSIDYRDIGRSRYSGGNIGFMNGAIDEVRVSNTDRSAAWIKATYNSGNDSLITFGSEEEGSAFIPLIIMF